MHVRHATDNLLKKEKYFIVISLIYSFSQLILNSRNLYIKIKSFGEVENIVLPGFICIAACTFITLIMAVLSVKYWFLNRGYKKNIKDEISDEKLARAGMLYIDRAEKIMKHILKHFYALLVFHIIHVTIILNQM